MILTSKELKEIKGERDYFGHWVLKGVYQEIKERRKIPHQEWFSVNGVYSFKFVNDDVWFKCKNRDSQKKLVRDDGIVQDEKAFKLFMRLRGKLGVVYE